ncbi:MAG TPA: response regulator, partial [Candidatus Methylacidiphilales bacterium]
MSGVAPAGDVSPAPPQPADGILIIDDNEENRYTFGRYLRQEGFDVHTAPTGAEGLERARRAPHPSLIMLDIQLPDTTGYELCRILKDDPLTASIPILHTSATYTGSEDRAHGLQGGADGYLTQPIDSRELVATVRALLRVRAAEQTARAYAAEWKAAFDSIRDAVCLVSPAGRIERFNRAFAALFPTAFVKPGDSFAVLASTLGNNLPLPLGEAQVGTRTEILLRGRWHRVANDPAVDEAGRRSGTVWVFSDIHSIREAERKLQDLNQELERRVSERTASLREAIHQMEQFSYTVSHDLRAPLRAMQGYSAALLEDYSGKLDEEALGYLRRIAKNAERLDRMIIDVLTFTR